MGAWWDVMGLELVDLSFRLKEELGITLSLDDAPELETVGDLHALVLARIAARDSQRCLALKVFRELREETRNLLGDPKLKLRPSDRVVDIVPWTSRRVFWRKLRGRFASIAIWDLNRPVLGRWLIAAAGLVGILFIFWELIVARGPDYFAPLGLLLICLLPFILTFITRPLKLIPPAHLRTFGEITLSEMSRTIATKPPPPNPIEVVDNILMDVVGADREEIVPTARLVKDLGMG